MTVLLTPTTSAKSSKVGGRTYRKQILKRGSLDYRQADGTTRRLNFDDDLFTDLTKAFHERAYDSAKVFAAGADNAHTVDVDRVRGTVVDLVPSEDGSGLDALVSLSESGARLVDEHPDMGVSARIVEGLTRGDGKAWPRALHHVLLTTDPKVTGMRGWESVDLSNDDGADGVVIDLSAATLNQEDQTMSDLSDSDIERIVAGLADRVGGAGPPAEEDLFDDFDENGEPPEIDWSEFFDEGVSESEVADLFADFDDDTGQGLDYDEGEGADGLVGAGAGADLSNLSDPNVFDLAAQNAALTEQVGQMRAEASAAKWASEREALLHRGVPPVLLDLAAPVLEASHHGAVLDLSNTLTGQAVNPAEVIRGLLAHAAGYVDLSAEVGHGAPSTSTGDDDTSALHAAWESEYGKAKS